jgi:hypothetical protein
MDSYALALDTIGYDCWDRAWLQQADLLLNERLMDAILGLEEPASLFTFHPRHDIFQFDPAAGKDFRRLIEPWRLKPHYPHEPVLLTVGFKPFSLQARFPRLGDHWHDVDYSGSYGRAIVAGENGEPSWIAKYGGIP